MERLVAFRRLLVTLVLFAVATGAQAGPESPGAKGQATVSMPFFVEDGHGEAISGINPSDLVITDGGKPPQSVLRVRAAKDLPLRMGVLIDTSESQGGSNLYWPAVKAASDLMKQVINSADDRVFVVTFAVTAKGTQFMNRDQMAKFNINLALGGGTALYDAVHLACVERMKNDPTRAARRVLIVLSDGDDNLSHVTLAKTIADLHEAETVVFAISTNPAVTGLETRGDLAMEMLASETGGSIFYNLSPKDLPKVFTKIQAQMNAMDSVTYIPSEPGKAGDFRRVEMKSATDKKHKVHAPKGYYVPAATK